MTNLVISATEKIAVELFENGVSVGGEFVSLKNESEEILNGVKQKLGGKNILDVDNILLNVGPGSFTGIRASMALVFGLTRKGKPSIVPFTSFDMFEYDKVSSDFIRVVAGFSSFVYASFEKDNKNVMECIDAIKLASFAKTTGKTIAVSSALLKEKFEKLGASAVIASVEPANVNKLFECGKLEKRQVEPVYLRASQAEIQREEKLKNEKSK